MKEKIKKIVVVLFTFLILFLILWLAFNDSKKEEENKIIPTQTPTPTIEEQISTGGEEIVFNEDQEKMFKNRNNLYEKMPIENNFFKMTFDYKTANFLVVFKENIIDKNKVLENWLIENNYSNILMENFIIK